MILVGNILGRPAGLYKHPGFISGNWYNPVGQRIFSSAGNPGINTIFFTPFPCPIDVSLQKLGFRVGGTAAVGNIQAAVYASNPLTLKPTGNALVATASMSTAAANTNINSAAVVTLRANQLYWMAENIDNATAVFLTVSPITSDSGNTIGSSSQVNLGGSLTNNMVGYSFAQTFGTWPDMTGQTVADSTSTSIPIVQMQIA